MDRFDCILSSFGAGNRKVLYKIAKISNLNFLFRDQGIHVLGPNCATGHICLTLYDSTTICVNGNF